MVRFNSRIIDCDVFGQPEMIAQITGFKPDMDEVSAVFVDYSVAKEHNLALQAHNWWINGMSGQTGTIFEAGLMKEDRMQDTMYVDTPDDIPLPFDLVAEEGTPMADYLKVKAVNPSMKDTYVEWLEERYRSLTAEVKHLAEEVAGESL